MKESSNFKNAKKIDRELKKLTSKQVVIGMAGEVAEYAVHNEYGTKDIPARPFFRNALIFEEGHNAVVERVAEQVKTILHGNTADKVLNNIGLYCKGRVIKSIKYTKWTPNALKTIKKKGTNKPPLVDSGKMVSSVEFEVVDK
ncbi:MAG: hypothetical protein ACRDDH_18075 [Cetobacterium sp.]|uniref:hypothetical protein n=1 Tax=Cetobacterium sp. TaxID=2071632 RepID=UPI003EE7677A